MILVDGHLDLAFNRLGLGRDPRASALDVRRREADEPGRAMQGRCMVGLPQMRDGRVGLVFATIFLLRRRDGFDVKHSASVTYDSAGDAERLGRAQLDVYRKLDEDDGSGFRLVDSVARLDTVLDTWKDGAVGDVGLVPLLEGADPLRGPGDVAAWKERGLRIVGLAWRSTRYSGGTGEPGGLTKIGRELVQELHRQDVILDLSHAAEEAFFEALDLDPRAPIASHSNPRAICPGDRQLSDEMIRRITSRGGVVGCVPFNLMLMEDWRGRGRPPVPLRRFGEAIRHVADVAGSHLHVAVGSDLDGGFGAEAVPEGLDTLADLPRTADVLADLGFDDDQIRDILGRNWIRFLRERLPAT